MKHERLCLTFSLAGALTLAACGDDHAPVDPEIPDGSVNPPPTYSVGGSVAGLSGTLTLKNNGGDDLALTANGSFTFDTELADGASYTVTVSAQPDGQLCSVASGSGTIDGADVTDVTVTCAAERRLTTFSGTLRDQTGKPIAGATLTVGDVSATSAADGAWTVTDAPDDATLVINAGAEFLPFRVETNDFPDGVTDQVLVLREADLKMTIDPAQAIKVIIGDSEEPNPAEVEIPALPGINEDLVVRGWYYNAANPSAMASAPVPPRGTDGTTEYGLISRGMIGMTFTGADSGTVYTDFSAAAEPFRVFIVMPGNAIGLTDTIDLWRATDEDDTWRRHGTATYDEGLNRYQFEVTGWSMYNLANSGPRCEIRANFAGHMPGNTYELSFDGPDYAGYALTRKFESLSDHIRFANAAVGFLYTFNVVRQPGDERARGAMGCDKTPISVDFALDTTPPGAVTNLNVQPDIGTCSMTLTWTNPSDADYAGVEICPILSSQKTCMTDPVTKAKPETTHTFSGAGDINCESQVSTIFEFRTFDNKTPPNEATPTYHQFYMQ